MGYDVAAGASLRASAIGSEGVVARSEQDAVLAQALGGRHDSRTMAETVAARLRDPIIDGQLPPGTVLRLARIAEQLGVSIMPVREAFRLLEGEGLVRITPRRGAVVSELSLDDIEETYAVRVALEGLAARRATERLTARDRAEIGECYEQMARAREQGDLRAFIEADHDFHMRLYVASGRDHLIQSISDLTNRSRRYSPYGYRRWQTLDVALDAHIPILEAIDAGDAALAERLTGEHMAAAGARLLEAVRLETVDHAGDLVRGPVEDQDPDSAF